MLDYPINNLIWIEEMLPPGVVAVPKHGGMAYYLDEHLILILVEKRDEEDAYEYKGVTYPFEVWHGMILPIEYKKQSAFFLKYPFLENHPANKDWLYIPADTENFEDDAKHLIREINRRNPLLGIQVKFKAPKKDQDTTEAPKKKPKTTKAPKADKKRENAFISAMLKKKIK